MTHKQKPTAAQKRHCHFCSKLLAVDLDGKFRTHLGTDGRNDCEGSRKLIYSVGANEARFKPFPKPQPSIEQKRMEAGMRRAFNAGYAYREEDDSREECERFFRPHTRGLGFKYFLDRECRRRR